MLEKFEAYQIAKKFYWGCKDAKVGKHLRDQLLRASSSVVLNLAEASGRRTPADQRQYYSISFGSLRECRAILDLERVEDPELRAIADQLAAILYTLTRNRIPATVTETENQTASVSDSASVSPPGQTR